MLPADILKKVRRDRVRTNRLVNESLAESITPCSRPGHGILEVREYQFGDDIRSIDWNVTSRMGHPYVKKHVEERELTCDAAGGLLGVRRVRPPGGNSRETSRREICAILAFSRSRTAIESG